MLIYQRVRGAKYKFQQFQQNGPWLVHGWYQTYRENLFPWKVHIIDSAARHCTGMPLSGSEMVLQSLSPLVDNESKQHNNCIRKNLSSYWNPTSKKKDVYAHNIASNFLSLWHMEPWNLLLAAKVRLIHQVYGSKIGYASCCYVPVDYILYWTTHLSLCAYV